MSETFSIRAHFDGKTFVPNEPVDLPENADCVLNIESPKNGQQPAELPKMVTAETAKERLTILRELAKSMERLPEIPLEALRRVNMYADDLY